MRMRSLRTRSRGTGRPVLHWDAALTTIDVLLALPDDPRVRAWEPQARATFEAVGATAWAGLLDDALEVSGADAPAAEPPRGQRRLEPDWISDQTRIAD